MTPPIRKRMFENISMIEFAAILLATMIGGGGGSAGYIHFREPPVAPAAFEQTLNNLAGEVLLLRQANMDMLKELNEIKLAAAGLPPKPWRDRIRANEAWRWKHDHDGAP